MNRKIAWMALGLMLANSISCTKHSEADDLAKAQQCLDNVPEGQFSAADACLPLVKDYNSQQADILRCSIIMTSGGLMENKVVKAFNALKDTSQTNKAASFMAALSLDYTDVNAGYTKAVQADVYCQSSGVPGLMYISSIVVAGTYLTKTMAAAGLTGVDISDPSSINNAVTGLAAHCGATGGAIPADCTTDVATLGAAVTNLSNSYCSGTGANQDVCGQVSDAVNASGGDTTKVGEALLCYMNNKTYNPTTRQCQ